jgi:cellulose synthase/poly-beta-1,6-N-acetylglucosamine synthase-like glycosyltransferase
MTGFDVVFIAVYLTLLIGLSALAFHRLQLARSARRLSSTPLLARERAEWPTVLVQVPLYNERYVAERVIEAVCRLDYPADKLTVQILDDSTDGTTAIVAAAVARWQAVGVTIEQVRRGNREGFKAGALAAGLERSTAELVAIFDADFVPDPDMLKLLVPSFDEKDVGMVQARWAHLNRHDTSLTEAQAVLLDGHFVNEHGGRYVRGCFFNFNGTCGVWRRQAIIDAGGWSGETLTEDLDLSYRAQLAGWRFVYRPDVTVAGELPADVQAFKSQQHRWAKGSIETARLLLPRIWRAALPLKVRVEATFHLGANFAYPLVLLMTLLLPWAVMIRLAVAPLTSIIIDGILFAGSTVSLLVFYMLAERSVGYGQRAWRHMPLVLALGIGMAVNNTRAVAEALFKKRTAFNRTPKTGGKKTGVDAAYVVKPDWQSTIELCLGAYLLGGVLFALDTGRLLAVPFLALFAWGFLSLALGSLWPEPVSSGTPGKPLTAPAVAKRI